MGLQKAYGSSMDSEYLRWYSAMEEQCAFSERSFGGWYTSDMVRDGLGDRVVDPVQGVEPEKEANLNQVAT